MILVSHHACFVSLQLKISTDLLTGVALACLPVVLPQDSVPPLDLRYSTISPESALLYNCYWRLELNSSQLVVSLTHLNSHLFIKPVDACH